MDDKCVDAEVHSISRRGILGFTAAAAALRIAMVAAPQIRSESC
jgi:hypothetical protein